MTTTNKRVVLITGAAGGLGPAVAEAFKRSGAALALTDLSAERLSALKERLGMDDASCFTQVANITQHSDTQTLCQAAAAALGRIDVAVHLSGGFRFGPVHETSEESWNFLFDLNARSIHCLATAVVPIMKKQKSGVILHVGARAALHGDGGLGVYAATKAAVVRLTESMAAELMNDGIRVNCILPSVIDTAANRKSMPDVDPAKWVTPESLAEVLLFLASSAARDISGAAIPVYGRA